ncbi:hypothetical protein FRB99_000543 [Tulasnella sp. 403]|nr:hypothetical protein FRB99_000543 [Tulasnella sp. 403]
MIFSKAVALFAVVLAASVSAVPMPLRGDVEARGSAQQVKAVEVLPLFHRRANTNLEVNMMPSHVATRSVNGKIELFEKRQTQVQDAVMSNGGAIVPYSNPQGNKKRQEVNTIPEQLPTMSKDGSIIPYENTGSKKRSDVKREINTFPLHVAARSDVPLPVPSYPPHQSQLPPHSYSNLDRPPSSFSTKLSPSTKMMNYYHVVSRKFCCCLPVRIGVFVLSALSAFFGGISAFVLWYVVVRTAKYGTVDDNMSTFDNLNSTSVQMQQDDWQDTLNSVALDKQQYIAFIVVAIILTVYTLFSIFGFVGSIFRKRALVAIYSSVLWVLLLINLASGIYMCIATIRRRNDLAAECADDAANDNNTALSDAENKFTEAACNAASKIGVAVYIAAFVIQWLIQLYACIIVKRYVEQLSEEQAYNYHTGGNKVGKGSKAAGSYYPHQPLGSSHELMPAPGGAYAYAHPDHSFGSKA